MCHKRFKTYSSTPFVELSVLVWMLAVKINFSYLYNLYPAPHGTRSNIKLGYLYLVCIQFVNFVALTGLDDPVFSFFSKTLIVLSVF